MYIHIFSRTYTRRRLLHSPLRGYHICCPINFQTVGIGGANALCKFLLDKTSLFDFCKSMIFGASFGSLPLTLNRKHLESANCLPSLPSVKWAQRSGWWSSNVNVVFQQSPTLSNAISFRMVTVQLRKGEVFAQLSGTQTCLAGCTHYSTSDIETSDFVCLFVMLTGPTTRGNISKVHDRACGSDLVWCSQNRHTTAIVAEQWIQASILQGGTLARRARAGHLL